MDFVRHFPLSLGFDYIWVILCQLTSQVHLIAINTTTKVSDLAWIYFQDIVQLHGLALSIVSDRDPKFMSRFWTELHRWLGGKLLMLTVFHPQTDGVTECTIQTVLQILRSMVKPDQTDWAEKLPMVEFAMNSSSSATMGYSPFELNYGYTPHMVCALDPAPAMPGVKGFAERTIDNLCMAHNSIIVSRVAQTYYTNCDHWDECPAYEEYFAVGRQVFLSTENLSLPKGCAHKLMPRFIGPYEVTCANLGTSHYTLALPDELRQHCIHPTFHITQLRPFELNDKTMFPGHEAQVIYDFGLDTEEQYGVDKIITHCCTGRTIQFYV